MNGDNESMNPYLMISLPLSATTYRNLVGAIPPARFDEASADGRFSPREVIAHVADWEPILRGRIRQAVESPDSTVQGIDEGQRAIEKNYRGTSLEEQLRIFEHERRATIKYLQSLGGEDWSKQVMHSERGRMSVGDMANMLLGHDIYHFEQLSEFLQEKSAGTW